MGFQIKIATGKLLDPANQEFKVNVHLEIAFSPSFRDNTKGRLRAMAEPDVYEDELWNKNYILQMPNKTGSVYLAGPLFGGSNFRQIPLAFEGPEWGDMQWFNELPDSQ